MANEGTADEADDEGHDPAETVGRQGRSRNDGLSKAQAAQARQGFQESKKRDQVYRALVGAVIGHEAADDAQDQEGQARRVADTEDPADVGDDTVDAEEGRQGRQDAADDSHLFVADAFARSRAGELSYGCNLTDSRRQAGQDDGYAHGNHDPRADALDNGDQEFRTADGLGIIAADAGTHVEQAAVDDEQQDEGNDAAVDEDFIALADSRIAFAVNGTDEDSSHDKADQDVARVIAAKEGVDEGMIHSRIDGRPQGIEDTGKGDDDQDQGQEGRQVFAHAVHDVILVSDEEEADDEINDDQRDERCRRQVALNTELDGRRAGTGNGYEGTDQHECCQKDIIRILPYPSGNGMDVAVEADDDECKNRQENTGQRQTSQAGQEITAAVQAELRRENQVACTEIGSEEGKPQDEHIQSPDGLAARRIVVHEDTP